MMTSNTCYILVDQENLQPKNIDLLTDGRFQLKLFLGQNQSKVPVELASAIQKLGDKAEYIPLKSSGKNALDFHIAYYIGIIAVTDPAAHVYVISNDGGYNPLLNYVTSKKTVARRYPCISEIPVFKKTLNSDVEATIDKAMIDRAVEQLAKRKDSKPKTTKTLKSSLHSIFGKAFSEEQIDKLIATLRGRGFLKVKQTQVTYQLPAVS